MSPNQNNEYDLIPVIQSEINGKVIPTVNARELHDFLEVKSRFNDWIKNRVSEYDFLDNQDFITLTKNLVSGGTQKEYHLTLDMAKELSMVERNEKGKQARQYFIECERKAKEPNPANLSRLQLIEIAMQAEQERIALEHKVEELTPKAEALDRIASPTEGAVCLRIAAKLLQIPEKKFIQFAHAKGFIFRGHFSRVWQGYGDKVKKGLVEMKITEIRRDDGSIKNVEQALITRAGIAKLAELLEADVCE